MPSQSPASLTPQSPAASAVCHSYLRVAGRANGVADVMIYGAIGASLWGDSISAKQLVDEINALKADTLHVHINSEGGVVPDGIAIYSALRAHAARKVGFVDGQAASIAGVILMACDEVVMYPTSLFMVHAPATIAAGNATDFRRFADVLDTHARAIAEAYIAKTGRPEDIGALLADGQDHWFTGSEAYAFGFADRIAEDFQPAAVDYEAIHSLIGQMVARSPQYGTQIRAALRPHHQSGQRRGENPMPQPQQDTREEILAQERNRVSDIRALASPHLNAAFGQRVRDVMDRSIEDGATPDEFGRRVLAVLAEQSEPIAGRAGFNAGASPLLGGGRGSPFVRAASDVLAMRGGILVENPHPGAADIRAMSISEMARACLSRHDMSRGLSGAAAIRAALSTSDFPAILGDAIGKALRRGYEQEPGTHSAWVRMGTVPDFKEQTRAILGAMPDLLPVMEGGEYKHGSVDEDKSVPFKVEKFGRIIEITWEALVNDDLSALTRIPQGLGQAARRKEADLVYSLFEGSGQIMQDGSPLFHADHGNLASSSTALDEAALAKGRLLLRKQTSVGGGALNLTPKFLIVPPELEGAAEKVLAASSIHVSAGLENATPEWIRRLQLIVESRLPATAAYLLADNNQIDTVELATLESEEPTIGKQVGPHVSEEDGFDNDTKKFKVRLVAGAKWLDWRGVVKLPIS